MDDVVGVSRRAALGMVASLVPARLLAGLPIKPATAPYAMGALELSAAIHARQISCVEVMGAFLDRIDKVNPRINAIVGMAPRDGLLAQARDKDALLAKGQVEGWLHGIPFAVKDLTPVAGLPFTQGSPNFRSRIAAADGAMPARLRAAGAVFIGKTNSPEFGLGSHTYNPVWGLTRNPYDQNRSAGGSSGGAAAGLAARMLAVADGSDIGGSLRNPAAWNNVYGLRPTVGRLIGSGEGFNTGLAVAGPMARSPRDLGALLATQSAATPYAPLSLGAPPLAQYRNVMPMAMKGVKIGWLGDFGGLPMEPGVLDLCRKALGVLEAQGAIVEPVKVDAPLEGMWQNFMDIRAAGNANNLGPLYRDPAKRALLKPEAIWEIERGMALSATDLLRAEAGRTAWYRAFARLFDTYAFMVAPAAQLFPFDVAENWPHQVAGKAMDSYHRWMEVACAITMTGCPALAAPAGFGVQGLPIGFQIVAPLGQEGALLRVAEAYHRATMWPEKGPPVLGGMVLRDVLGLYASGGQRAGALCNPVNDCVALWGGHGLLARR